MHIKGIPSEDRSGNGLKLLLDKHMSQRGGKVLAIQIVPPFSKMFEIESKIRDMKYYRMLVDSGESENNFFCCVPKDMSDFSKFEFKLEKYEEKLLDETLKPFVPSGHAFVCFDS